MFTRSGSRITSLGTNPFNFFARPFLQTRPFSTDPPKSSGRGLPLPPPPKRIPPSFFPPRDPSQIQQTPQVRPELSGKGRFSPIPVRRLPDKAIDVSAVPFPERVHRRGAMERPLHMPEDRETRRRRTALGKQTGTEIKQDEAEGKGKAKKEKEKKKKDKDKKKVKEVSKPARPSDPSDSSETSSFGEPKKLEPELVLEDKSEAFIRFRRIFGDSGMIFAFQDQRLSSFEKRDDIQEEEDQDQDDNREEDVEDELDDYDMTPEEALELDPILDPPGAWSLEESKIFPQTLQSEARVMKKWLDRKYPPSKLKQMKLHEDLPKRPVASNRSTRRVQHLREKRKRKQSFIAMLKSDPNWLYYQGLGFYAHREDLKHPTIRMALWGIYNNNTWPKEYKRKLYFDLLREFRWVISRSPEFNQRAKEFLMTWKEIQEEKNKRRFPLIPPELRTHESSIPIIPWEELIEMVEMDMDSDIKRTKYDFNLPDEGAPVRDLSNKKYY